MSTRLIRNYKLAITSPECHRESEWLRARMELDEDISEVLPYLNRELEAYDYQHSVKVLLVKRNGRLYAFRPREIAIAPVFNREEGEELAGGIVEIVNDVWERRNGIEPDFEGRGPLPSVLEIYKLLPRTNCKECGFPTCMAYANALRNDSTKLPCCPYISEEAYSRLIS